jgi:hypothetical protein
VSKLTRAQEADTRLIMALYYAYGRKDAAGVAGQATFHIDPDKFAADYRSMFVDMQNGRVGFCPSVQDAFGYYLTTVTP